MGRDQGGMTMVLQAGDILTMKKAHPCGDKRFLVLHAGEELRLRCLGCGRELEIPMTKIQRNIRAVQPMKKSST